MSASARLNSVLGLGTSSSELKNSWRALRHSPARLASTHSDKRGFVVALSGGLLFDTGKNTLKAGAKSTLTKIAEQLKSNPDAKISVEGHTDSVGTEAKTQELSQKRADAVREDARLS